MRKRLKQFILIGGDIAILYFALYLTLIIRYKQIPDWQLWQSHFYIFSFIFIFWILIFYIFNLYNLHYDTKNQKIISLGAKALFAVGLFSLSFFYLLPEPDITPKRNLLLLLVIFFFLFYFWRKIFNISLLSLFPREKIIFIGYNNLIRELIEEISKKPHLGLDVDSIFELRNNNISKHEKSVLIEDYSQLKNEFEKRKINVAVICLDPRQSDVLRSVLFDCLPMKINYLSLTKFYENLIGKIPLEVINQMWFLENLNESEKKFYEIFKKISDFILAFLILIITLPLWFIFALIIKAESSGPVFFRQKRLGKDKKIFELIKFRSMRENNNDRSLTLENDQRITSFGKFIRKTRIDELPQLINIIKGQMSFVGPRPERPDLAIDLEKNIPFYKERMLVKPGLSGWDQVSGEYHSPSLEDTIKKIQYDLYYIKNRSSYLDFSIILKTIYIVFTKKGI